MPTKNTLTASVFAFLAALSLAAGTGCAAAAESPADTNGSSDEAAPGEARAELRISTGLNADGDACVHHTNPDGTTVPGTVKGLECCSTADPADCIIILKPFPSGFSRRF